MSLSRSGVAIAAVVAAFATACAGASTPAAAPARPRPTPTASPCPTPAAVRDDAWPKEVPAGLPKPPHVSILTRQTTPDGVRIVRFSTPQSLRTSVLFVISRLPKAGYVLGRGDAEQAEADAPFVHGRTRGLLRMLAAAPCRTVWLLALAPVRSSGASPGLPSHSPSGGSSPLPFG